MKIRKLLFLCLLSLSVQVSAFDGTVCLVYFTRIGCPHCAATDPTVLGELPLKYSGRVAVVEYEVSSDAVNSRLLGDYVGKAGSQQGVPQLFYSGGFIVGDEPILTAVDDVIGERLPGGSPCFLPDASLNFREINPSRLPGNPKIWFKDRVLIREAGSSGVPDDVLRSLLFSDNPATAYPGVMAETTPAPAQLSGSEIQFTHALRGGGWLLEWGGERGDRVKYTSAFYYLLTHMDYYIGAVLIIAALVLLYRILK
jgi:glutaredoxin